MLPNQNKALLIILTNQNKAMGIKKKQSSENSRENVSGTAVRLNIFSNIQRMNKKFGSDIDGHLREHS